MTKTVIVFTEEEIKEFLHDNFEVSSENEEYEALDWIKHDINFEPIYEQILNIVNFRMELPKKT